jgi:hypothetical protein
MVKRGAEDLHMRIVGATSRPAEATRLLGSGTATIRGGGSEVEVLFLPGEGRYSGRADCNILVVLEDSPAAAKMARKAHIVVAEKGYPGVNEGNRFGLDEFDLALRAVA